MAYTENKKIGGLTQVGQGELADVDNMIVEQSGTAKKATLLQLISKVFTIGTVVTDPNSSDSAVVVRQNGTVGKASLSNLLASNSVTNTMLVGNITADKLNPISTPGKVLNDATSATDGRTGVNNATYNAAANDDIVKRDSNGDFSANVITASLSGNASTATNLSGRTANSLLFQSAASTTGEIVGTDQTSGKYLRSNGPNAAPTWESFASVSSTADNIVGGAAGTLVYQESATTTKFLSPGATNSVLMSPGLSSPPTWYPTATISATPDTIVRRDSQGNFSGGVITATTKFSGPLEGAVTGNVSGSSGSCTGNAATATRWQNGRTIQLTGGVTGTSAAFDGTTNLTFATTVDGTQHTHTDLTAATNANTPSTIVKRDASGNFSAGAIAATSVTANTLTGTASSIADGAVSTAAKLASNVVTTAKLPDATTTTDGVTNAKLRWSGGLSVVGRSANTTGVVADITGADGQVLRVAGTSLGFGTITNAALAGTVVTGHSAETTVNDTDEFLLYRAGGTNALRKITGANLKTSVAPSAPSGSIVKTYYHEIAAGTFTNSTTAYDPGAPSTFDAYTDASEIGNTAITITATNNPLVVQCAIEYIDSAIVNPFYTAFLVANGAAGSGGGGTVLSKAPADAQSTARAGGCGMMLMGRFTPSNTSNTIRVYIGGSTTGTHSHGKISIFIQEIKA